MALIKCKECGNEVSDRSKKCIKCGYPIESLTVNPDDPQVKTIQETSKKFKMQTLMSVSLMIFGVIFAIAVSDPSADESDAIIPGFMMVGGFFWYVVNRFRIWWHHK